MGVLHGMFDQLDDDKSGCVNSQVEAIMGSSSCGVCKCVRGLYVCVYACVCVCVCVCVTLLTN